ncbi:TraR/DksA family transcriptional regulator [Actinomadura welshii]
MTVNSAVGGATGGHPPGGARARELLLEERRTRLAQLAALDRAEDGAADEAALARRDSLQTTIEEVDAALARLDDGTYGRCEDCARPVPAGRLEIIPYARRCVQCQQRRR